MNEHIKKLLLEANKCHVKPDDWFVWTPQNLEKFAELIVEECLSLIKTLPPGYTDYRNQIEDAFRFDCIEKIQRHFEMNSETNVADPQQHLDI